MHIANHGQQEPGYLIWTFDEMNRLIEAVPSNFNGVTLCTGCYQLAGDDLSETIHGFGKKIFLIHARDVAPKPGGFNEVMYGQGDVDIISVLRELRDIGYAGPVCPEHLAAIDYEPYEEIAAAWGLGYLSGVLRMLET